MTKKKRVSIVETLEDTVSDMANAVSVAATGSEIGILELAAEERLKPRRSRMKIRRPKAAAKKKKAVAKKPSKVVTTKRGMKRRKR